MDVQFGVLGEIEVLADGTPLDIGHLRQRSVLAGLLLEPDRTVSAAQLVDRIWGERPPQRARETLYVYVSRLRRALGEAGRLDRTAGGYVLAVDARTIDVHRFRTLVDQARTTDAGQAAFLLEEALGLWRKEPFAGVDTPWFNEQRELLEGERFTAELELTDIQLRESDNHRLLPGLRGRAQAHPLNERVAGQLMLALHRCGRTAEALEQFSRIRRALAEELGIDPSPALKKVLEDVLSAADAPADKANLDIRAGTPAPRQLPTAPGAFTGRKRALDQLTAALTIGTPSSSVRVAVVSGAGGIGKTSLVLHWAQGNLDQFPDGQLFIDLRGFDPTDEPVPVETALAGLLHALGAANVPPDSQARAGLYRTLLAGKRMLIVLDNAVDSTQVTPLLPGSPSSSVIVTSRRQLGGLLTQQAATPVDLDVLDQHEARELLAGHIGVDRADVESEAFTELVDLCAGLPLALAVVSARVASRPDFPLVTLTEELRDAEARLDGLSTGELDAGLRTVFGSSYRALDPEAAELFALLGLAPGSDIGIAAAAALAGLSLREVRAILYRLESANLVQQHVVGRYRMHDLVRLYALDRAQRQSPDRRQAALRRLFDHYVHTACAADHLLTPLRPQQQLDPPADGSHPVQLTDRGAAMAWFDAEHDGLLAAQRMAATEAWHSPVWQLAWALLPYQNRGGRFDSLAVVWDRALTCVPHLDDQPATQAMIHRFFGRSRSLIGRHEEAIPHLEKSLAFADSSADTLNAAHAHQALAAAWDRQGDYQRALVHGLQQLELYRGLHRPKLEADAVSLVGWLYARLAQFDEGWAYCGEALVLYRELGDRDGEADVQDSLGLLAFQAGRYSDALGPYQQAIALYRELGNNDHESQSWDRLGDSYAALGDHPAARKAWQEALTLFLVQQRTEDAARIRQQLDELA